jgi:hypothetical protein
VAATDVSIILSTEPIFATLFAAGTNIYLYMYDTINLICVCISIFYKDIKIYDIFATLFAAGTNIYLYICMHLCLLIYKFIGLISEQSH